MARADSARRTTDDEIPLARRAGSQGLAKFKLGFGAFWAFGICLLIFGFGFALNLFSWPFSKGPLNRYPAQPSEDGRLLGHFPYPEAAKEDLITIYPGLKVHVDTYNALKLLREAAAVEGIDLSLLSGYRSHALQKEIFFEVKSVRNQTASERSKVSAPPGYSEHSTGYAIDLGDMTRPETNFSIDFASTKAFRWLKKNAAKYHFVLSFPPDNEQGVSYEPWHWRFEGTADALRQFEVAR